MARSPDLYWKVRVEQSGQPVRFEFITKEQAKTRGLIGQLLLAGEEAAYVRISAQTYQTYKDWKRANR